MADAEHLELLKQGVAVWNQWREDNPKVKPELNEANLRRVDLTDANLSNANLIKADLGRVNLTDANLRGAKLFEANLCGANLLNATLSDARLDWTDLRGADLRGANLDGAYLIDSTLRGADLLEATLNGANLIDADLNGLDLSALDFGGAHLMGAKLCNVKLIRSSLRGADLRGADLRGADLRGADLCRTHALKVRFEKSIFTGACLEDWNINSATNLNGVVCGHIYLQSNYKERRPHGGSFQPGEFTQRFQKFLETIDLFFVDGVDWKAFLISFQELQSRYGGENIAVQGIERKGQMGFEIRLAVPLEADKAEIEKVAYERYKINLKQIETQYEKQLELQGAHLEDIQLILKIEREERTRLLKVVERMAEGQTAPKYDLSNAQFAGGFAETVQGDQIGGTVNNAAAETPSLAEAAAEIQSLLKQLEASNPAATEAEQTAYLSAIIPLTRRERFIGALRAASGAAIEEVPYGAVLKALVDGWQKPEG